MMSIIVRKPTQKEIDAAKKWPIWEKAPSEFPYEYDEKETCLILEGEAEVKSETESVTFKAGDLVIFPKGLVCDWHIKKKIRKHYLFG
jgi:uncharacterized protein